MENLSYIIIFILNFLTLLFAAYYSYKNRKKLDEMHGMMVGMMFGLIAGMIPSTLYVIVTGNFLNGMIIGTFFGLIFGIPFGRLGGHLGVMEGVMAGPMGGIMGAMTGQMVRPFNIEIFMPYMMFIFIITILGIIYTVRCGCAKKDNVKAEHTEFWIYSLIIFIVLIGASIALDFKLNENTQIDIQENNGLKLPTGLQSLDKETTAVIKDGYQEVDLLITANSYVPNIIKAKKGIPLRINLISDINAGCGSDIIFPELGIEKIVPPGETRTITIDTTKEGTYKFRCSMDMLRGKLIIS
ncbi:MAG: cupredoxin domain-containing protein [Nanoarchaeota archaeon]